MPLRDIPVFQSAYFPKKLFSFFSKTLDLQVRCAHPTGNFAPKRPFGTFRCCGRLICRKEYAVLFSTKRSTFSRFAIYEGSQRRRCALIASPVYSKDERSESGVRAFGAAKTKGLLLYAEYRLSEKTTPQSARQTAPLTQGSQGDGAVCLPCVRGGGSAQPRRKGCPFTLDIAQERTPHVGIWKGSP